jgi:hypothetical protein
MAAGLSLSVLLLLAIVFRGPVAHRSRPSDVNISKQVSFVAIIASAAKESKEYDCLQSSSASASPPPLTAGNHHPPRHRRHQHTKELMGVLLLLVIVSSAVAGYWQSLVVTCAVCTMGVSRN